MIPDRVLAAAVQMNSTVDKPANLDRAFGLVQQAADEGAQLVVLPELFNCLGSLEQIAAAAEPIPGPTSRALSQLAARLQITLCAGSIGERAAEPGKAFNTSLLFGPDGRLLARYRKIHLFDACLPSGLQVQESRYMIPGDRLLATDTPAGTLGQATCYDLRFPEQFRGLADAHVDVVLLPSAFTHQTGRHHWHVLVRARAIENQVYVIAANQCGYHNHELVSYGHSLIVDAWGQLLAEAGGEREEVIVAELTGGHLHHVRGLLPVLDHRRDVAF